MHHDVHKSIGTLIKRRPVVVLPGHSLRTAVQLMATENVDVLPVVDRVGHTVVGVLSYKDILAGYRQIAEEGRERVAISLKRRTLKMLVHGKKGMAVLKPASKEES